jgi:hypothetical protein
MDVNKIKIQGASKDRNIIIPLSMDWDLMNREKSIIDEEKTIIEKVIGTPPDYELARFSRSRNIFAETNQNYTFSFNDGSNWVNSYLPRFNENQVKFFSDGFKKSFFKMDLYDSTDNSKQKIFLSIILMAQNSEEIPNECNNFLLQRAISNPANLTSGSLTYTDCCNSEVTLSLGVEAVNVCVKPNTPTYWEGDINEEIDLEQGSQVLLVSNNVGPCYCTSNFSTSARQRNLLKPQFILDHVGKTEGYFIYWYEDKSLLNIDTLYMKAKFFDGLTGQYTRFTNQPQSNFANQYKVSNNSFYYRVNFNYNNYTYSIINPNNNSSVHNAQWYEYINPPI